MLGLPFVFCVRQGQTPAGHRSLRRPLRYKQAAPAFLRGLNLPKHKPFQGWKPVFILPADPCARFHYCALLRSGRRR